jgi:hypothetical protein
MARRIFPVRHIYGRYYGDGVNEDCYDEDKEFYHDKHTNTRGLMIPAGKGQNDYINSMAGEVKTYKINDTKE